MDDTAADAGRSLTLGKSQTLVHIMDRARAITAGLQDNNEHACFEAVVRRHPEFLVKGLSAHYPIDADVLEHFADEWNWEALSALHWTLERIDCYEEKWDWGRLSCNSFLPWTQDLIERYADRWDWPGLSGNAGLPWTQDLIERYADRWDWPGLS
jgi:hypothetical protein